MTCVYPPPPGGIHHAKLPFRSAARLLNRTVNSVLLPLLLLTTLTAACGGDEENMNPLAPSPSTQAAVTQPLRRRNTSPGPEQRRWRDWAACAQRA